VPAVRAACKGLRFRVWLATLDDSRPRDYDGLQLLGVQYRTQPGRFDESDIWEKQWPWKP
jgi:hypothetical protein